MIWRGQMVRYCHGQTMVEREAERMFVPHRPAYASSPPKAVQAWRKCAPRKRSC